MEILEERRLLASIQLAAELYPGGTPASIDEIVSLHNQLYVDARGDLFATRGTQSSTRLVKTFGYVTTDELTATSSQLFIRVWGASGRHLWVVNETATWTSWNTADITPANLSADQGYHAAFGSRLFFAGTASGSSSTTPWVSDGTMAGTVELTAAPLVTSIDPVVIDAQLYFVAGTSGAYKLYRTDGTPSGTQAIFDIPTLFANEMAAAGDKLVLSLPNQQWSIAADGTATQVGSSFDASDLFAWKGVVYYSGCRGGIGSEGWELWRSDGTPAGTYILKDIYPGTFSSYPEYFAAGDTRLYFVASTSTAGAEWWLTDGTSEGTRLAGELFPGTAGLNTSAIAANGYGVVHDTLFFENDVTTYGPELCQTDGTQVGTRMVQNLRGTGTEEWIGSWPTTIRALGSAVYFEASSDTVSQELFRYAPGNQAHLWGGVYADANHNAVFELGETGMAGITVYDDVNGNSLLDAGEASAVTGADGTYYLELASGSHRMTALLPGNMGQSTSSTLLSVAAGQMADYPAIGLYVNTPPSVLLQPSYSVNEGQWAPLSVIAMDAEGSVSRIEWDLDYDGTFEVTGTGASPAFSALDIDGPATRQIAARAYDRANAVSSIAVSTVQIVNVSPTATFNVPNLVPAGTDALISLSAITDPSATDRAGLRYDFDFNNDGTFEITNSATPSAQIPASYLSATGAHSVRAVVRDDDGGSSSYLKTINACALSFSTLHIPELTPAGSAIGSVSVIGAPGVSIVYSLSAGDSPDDNASFSLQGNQLIINDSPDFEAKNVYRIHLSGAANGLKLESTFTIDVTDINEAPTDIQLSGMLLTENAGQAAVVGMLTGSDPDAGDSVSFALAAGEGDTDNGLFEIADGQLRAKQSLDFEQRALYSVRLSATDSKGLVFAKSFALSLRDVNESPTALTLSNTTVAENAGDGALVGAVSGTDPDAGDAISFSFAAGDGGSDNALFQLAGGQLRAVQSLNYEQRHTYSVRIRATDVGGLSIERSFSIGVTNVNEAPTSVSLSRTSVSEGAGAGAVIGNLSATDPDAASAFTYSLVSGAGSADNARFQIVSGQLRAISSFDYETNRSYSIRVRAKDAGGLFVEKAFTIAVSDVPESPLTCNGSAGNDVISLTLVGSTLRTLLNGAVVSERELALISDISVNAMDGDDRVTLSSGIGVTALIYGGAGNDTITGGSGNDTIYGNFGDDVIAGGAGNDSILAGIGADSITGASGNDSIFGGDNCDTIRGGDGNDYIEGKGKADTIYGDAGDDTIYGQAGSDLIYAGDGADQIHVDDPAGGSFRDTVYAGNGSDRVWFDSLDSVLEAESNILA